MKLKGNEHWLGLFILVLLVLVWSDYVKDDPVLDETLAKILAGVYIVGIGWCAWKWGSCKKGKWTPPVWGSSPGVFGGVYDGLEL